MFKETGKQIFFMLKSQDQRLLRKAFELLKGTENNGIYIQIRKKIGLDLSGYGVKGMDEQDWAEDILNQTYTCLWERVRDNKFTYFHELAFWRYVRTLWRQLWLKALRDQFGWQKHRMQATFLHANHLHRIQGWEEFIEPASWDVESVFRRALDQLSPRYQQVYWLYSMNPEWSEEDILAYAKTHLPEIEIPKSGLRMIKSRSEKKLKQIVLKYLEVA